MSTRVFWCGVVVFLLTLFAIGPEKANASCCGMKYYEFAFQCGTIPCENTQHASDCAQGGCRDCIDCAGSGQCTCGSQTYCSAVVFKCGLGRRQQAVLNLKQMDRKLPRWVEIAVRDCRGSFERFDSTSVRPAVTSTSIGGGY
jgi:hypothetical protein